MTLDLHDLVARAEITDVLHRMARCQDEKNWEALDDVLADLVTVSYSTTGPVRTSRADLVENWKSGLQRAEASQHVLSGMLINLDGERASVAMNETAWVCDPEAFGSRVFTFGTTMTVGLHRSAPGWRVTSLTVRQRWVEGNAAVLGNWQPPEDQQ